MADQTIAAPSLELVRWLCGYQAWTWGHLLAAARGLDEERLRRPGTIPGGNDDGSVFAALAHIVDAEETWLRRWQGREARPPGSGPAGLDEIADWRDAVERERGIYLDQLDAGALARPFDPCWAAKGVLLWHAIVHVVTHSAHHRAEASTALTALGSPPADLDVIDFVGT
jgi:uncharacterized damage-inducible protein DinB